MSYREVLRETCRVVRSQTLLPKPTAQDLVHALLLLYFAAGGGTHTCSGAHW